MLICITHVTRNKKLCAYMSNLDFVCCRYPVYQVNTCQIVIFFSVAHVIMAQIINIYLLPIKNSILILP